MSSDRLLRLTLDVTSPQQVDTAVDACLAHFGRIDVLVNNAGYGYLGAIEESDEADVRQMFEVNFWGLAAATRRVLIVEPSGFRTDWAGRSIKQATSGLDDYAATAAKRAAQIRANSGAQPGDPVRAAQAIMQAVNSDSPPQRLLLGRAAFTFGMQKVESLRSDFETWKDVSIGADFPTST